MVRHIVLWSYKKELTDELPAGDVALLSEFESREALEAYQVHPAHLKAKEYVGSVTCGRACMDFQE